MIGLARCRRGTVQSNWDLGGVATVESRDRKRKAIGWVSALV